MQRDGSESYMIFSHFASPHDNNLPPQRRSSWQVVMPLSCPKNNVTINHVVMGGVCD